MLETALVAFTTFFATVGPPDVAAIFAALSARESPGRRRAMALRAVFVAALVLLPFALFGRALLASFGVGLPALQTAGGLLLFLIAVDLVFARDSGGVSTTSAETAEAHSRPDISVFPIATPLIAGPGTITASMVLVADAPDPASAAIVIAMLAAVLAVTAGLLLIAPAVQRLLGVTGLHVISRILGLLLAALAVQFVFDGIAASGLLGR